MAVERASERARGTRAVINTRDDEQAGGAAAATAEASPGSLDSPAMIASVSFLLSASSQEMLVLDLSLSPPVRVLCFNNGWNGFLFLVGIIYNV